MAISPNKIGVLVVEDHMAMRKIVKTVLQAMGIKTVYEAADGAEAMTLLKSRSVSKTLSRKSRSKDKIDEPVYTIDLIISDVVMPRMDGIDLLAAVRSDKKLAKVPFFLLTAENSREQITRALELGVTDYIIKPFTATVLEQKLRSLLSSMR